LEFPGAHGSRGKARLEIGGAASCACWKRPCRKTLNCCVPRKLLEKKNYDCPNYFRALAILLLLAFGNFVGPRLSDAACQAPRPRSGLPFDGSPGPLNAITDVSGVTVGHTTLISGEGKLQVGNGPVRTGVTPYFRAEKTR